MVEDVHGNHISVLLVDVNVSVEVDEGLLVVLLDPVYIDLEQLLRLENWVKPDLVAEIDLQVVDVLA